MKKERIIQRVGQPTIHIFEETGVQPDKKPAQPASNTSNVKPMLRGLTTTADKPKITALSGSEGSPITGQGALTAGAATGGLQEPQKITSPEAKRLEAGIRQPQKDEPKSIAAKENVVPIFSQKESREPGLQDAFLRNFQKDSLKPTPLPLFTVPGKVKPAIKEIPLSNSTRRTPAQTENLNLAAGQTAKTPVEQKQTALRASKPEIQALENRDPVARTPERQALDWMADWASRSNTLLEDYNNRYTGRTGDVTDAYVGDAQEYLDTLQDQAQTLEAEIKGIREFLNQNSDNLSPKLIAYYNQILDEESQKYEEMLDVATRDASYWAQFKNEEGYATIQKAAKLKVELGEMDGVKEKVDELLSQISTFNPYAYADATQAAAAEQALKAQLAELTESWGGLSGFDKAYSEKLAQYNALLGIETGTWFQKGAFADGYQFGDHTKTLVGTANDIHENVTHAALDATENLIDTVAFGIGQLSGSEKFQDKVGKFIAKEPLTKDEMGAKLSSILNWTTPHGQATKLLIGDNTEENSILGSKADGLTQSAAHLVGSKALSMVGVPAELTMGVNAFGSEIENAYKNGASHEEAWVSASAAAGAEILFEKLFGGIKFGGKTLDEGATKALSRRLSNRITRSILKWMGDTAMEGGEEVLTELTTNVARKITYQDEKAWREILWSDEYLDAFVGGVIMGGAAGGYKAVNSGIHGVEYASGLTEAEEKLVRREYENRVAEHVENGEKLTPADRNKIWDGAVEQVRNIGKTGWDGRVAVTEATGPNITVDGVTYKLLGKDANGSPVYQDVEVLKEQKEFKQREEAEPVSQEKPNTTENGQESVENPENRDILTLSTRYLNKNDSLYEYSKKITPLEDFEDVVTHGDPISLVFKDADGKESNVSAEEFVQILKDDPNYKGGNIRLVACQVAADGGAIPKYIANALGVTVIAPTEAVNVDWDGNMFLADAQEDIAAGIETGEWMVFEPGKEGIHYDLYWKIQ